MPTYSYTVELVTMGPGGIVRAAPFQTVTATDPVTGTTPAGLTQGGVPVSQLVADDKGLIRFTASVAPVELTSSALGFTRRVEPRETVGPGYGVNVRAAGAKGDGVTDDTAAIQAAINAGGLVYFPPGDYLCGTLTMVKGVTLLGANSGSYTYNAGTYSDDYPLGSVSKIIRKAGTNAPLISGPAGAKHVQIIGLELDGNNKNQTANNAHLVYLVGLGSDEDTQWLMRDCYVHGRWDPNDASWGNAGSNIYVGSGRMACRFLNVVCNYGNSHGFEISGADTTIDKCIVGGNGANGITLSAWVARVTDCDIYGNAQVGVYVADTGNGSPKRIMIRGNGIDRNAQHGVHVVKGSNTGAAGVSIMGNVFTSNGYGTNNTYAHIRIDATTGKIVVVGNVFSVLESGYTNQTTYAIHLGTGATALGGGNAYEGGSASGLTNGTLTM